MSININLVCCCQNLITSQQLSLSDLQAIESKKPNQIVFRINDKSLSFRPSVDTGTSEVDNDDY